MPLPIDRGNRAFTIVPLSPNRHTSIENEIHFHLLDFSARGGDLEAGSRRQSGVSLLVTNLSGDKTTTHARRPDARHPRLSRASTCPALPLAGPASPLILPLSVCRHQASPLIVPRLMTTHNAHCAVGLRNSEGETLCGG